MCEMDRNEKRAVIKYLSLKGLSAVEISTELNSVLRDNTPSDATIYRWIAEFQRGRKSTEDEQRSGRPVDMSCACTHENVQRVNDMITTDRRLTVSYVAKCLIWHHVITDVLGYSKVCARWVPRMLTPENNQVRLTSSRACQSPSVQRRSDEVSPQICHHGRDFGSSFRSRDQAAEQAVEAS